MRTARCVASQTVPRSSTTPRSSSAPMAAPRCRGESSAVTYSVAWTRMNMAPRVIATMRMEVRTEARIIFMGLELGRPEPAWRRIAQSAGKQKAQSAPLSGEQAKQALLNSAETPWGSAQDRADLVHQDGGA